MSKLILLKIMLFVVVFVAAIVTRAWAEPESPQTTNPPLNIDPQLRRALLQALTRLEKEAQEEAARLQEQDTPQSLDLPTASTPVRNEDFSSFSTQQNDKNENTQLTQVTYDEELSTDSLNDQGTKPTQTTEFDNVNFQGSGVADTTTQLPDETRPNTSFELLPEKFDIQSNVISTTNSNEKPVTSQNFQSTTTTRGVHSTESTVAKDGDKTTVSSDGSPLLDENDREVSIFQAPLVAAFTLHHDLDGLPKRVVPLFRPKPTAATPTNERPFQPLTKQRELEQRTIQLQQQLFNIQKQQLEQERFLKEQQQRQERLRQEQIFQEQERIRQQQLLQEQQRILQQQHQQQQLLVQQQRQREINFQQPRHNFFQTDNNTPFFQQQNQQSFFPVQSIRSNQPVQANQPAQTNSPTQVNQPIQTNQPLQLHSANQQIQTSQINQPIRQIQSLQSNQPIQTIQSNEPVQPILPGHRFQISRPIQSVQPIQPLQTQHLRSQRQETGTAIVDFQKSLTFPLVPPPLPSTSFQTPPLFNSDSLNRNGFGQTSFQNFGNSEPFIPIQDNTHQFNPIDHQQSKLQTNFASTPSKFQKPPPVDKQLQSLLFQSGIARDLQSNAHNGASPVEDINILTKVLSLNHENEENASKSQRSSRKTLESHHTHNVQQIQPPAIHLLAPHF